MTQIDTVEIQREKNESILILMAFYFLQGIGDYLIDKKAGIYPFIWLAGVVFGSIFMMRWFALDARQHKYKLSQFMLLMLGMFTPLAAPFYFFNTRGNEAWRSLLFGFVFLFCIGIFMLLGRVAAVIVQMGFGLAK